MTCLSVCVCLLVAHYSQISTPLPGNWSSTNQLGPQVYKRVLFQTLNPQVYVNKIWSVWLHFYPPKIWWPMIVSHIVISDQMRWKSKPLFSHLIVGPRRLWTNSHFIMKPADNGGDDKYFSIWSKRGIKTVVCFDMWSVHLAPNCFQDTAGRRTQPHVRT